MVAEALGGDPNGLAVFSIRIPPCNIEFIFGKLRMLLFELHKGLLAEVLGLAAHVHVVDVGLDVLFSLVVDV